MQQPSAQPTTGKPSRASPAAGRVPPRAGPPFIALARLVRQARLARRLTQRQLSRALGMSEGYVGHLERGRVRPTVATLKALATTLGLLYGQLAVCAGYITEQEYRNPLDETQLARLNEIGDLSNEEWESVKDFARYVRSRRHRSPSN